MRELLFRGKRTSDGVWVYGGIVHQVDYHGGAVCDKWFIVDGTEANDYGPRWLVDPNTIGQYTELTDANDKKIFEGDFLSFPSRTGEAKNRWYKVERSYDGRYVQMRDGQRLPIEPAFQTVVGNIYDDTPPHPPTSEEINAAIRHFRTGIDRDIFSEPVITHAKTALWALEQHMSSSSGEKEDK